MIPKKNPKVDMARKSGLFFAIGMATVLFLSWKGIEWKEYENKKPEKVDFKAETPLDEPVIPLITWNTPPPPPPPPVLTIPEDFEPVENDSPVKESELEPSDLMPDDPVDFDDIPVTEDPVPDEIIPINIVEEVPVFPGCENAEDKLKCFEERMKQHIRDNFRYPETAKDRGVQGKVYVSFVIDKEGNITGVKMRGPDKSLEAEAGRIIDRLPRMTPAKQGNQRVRVPFSVPITFKLQ
ncbi:protein TonB [Sinomicrobium oceani]|uniref:Protein TonB n=1 Tax=Sinomicrobium oceani TaxID=1150368 RepID=A0A1K1R0Y3_9FLAO|nr:energy transducer TonB [Sinomicrobium oceani]SFW65596.1 protein TonB [Sinomicrobium oceani]